MLYIFNKKKICSFSVSSSKTTGKYIDTFKDILNVQYFYFYKC